MARSGQKLRARNARPGDTVELAPGTSWYSEEVGPISYDDLTEKWGLIDKNPTGDTKNVICLADVSNTSTVQGTARDPDQSWETDASAIPEDQIDCIWIPIPDNAPVVMHTPGATKQLGSERNAGFIGLLRKGVRKIFGGGRQEGQEEPVEFAPTQITGLPVPLTAKVDEEPFIRVEESEPYGIVKSPDWRFGDREEDGSRKTGPEWEIALDIKVLDPDGFGERQEGVPEFYSLMTKEEFEQGLVGSTTRRGPNYQDQIIEGKYRVLEDDAYEPDQQDDVDRVLQLPPVRGENWEYGDNTPVERGGPLAVYDSSIEEEDLDQEIIQEADPKQAVQDEVADTVPYQEEIEVSRNGKRKRAGKFATRLGGAALSGFHAAAGKALEGTLAGKMLNIETKRLTMLSRVPVGETIAFTVGDDRVGVRRGDRGEVRMGGRGKDKVVYFHDTGEIVHPDQWTMVAITGKVPTPQTGTLGMGLGLFGQPGHWPQTGYRGDRGWNVPSSDGQTGQQHWGEFPAGFAELMLGIPVSHKDDASERQREIIAQKFNVRIGSKSSQERRDLYRRLRGQRAQPIIRGPEDEPGGPKQQKTRGLVHWSIKKNEDTDRWYLQTVIPAERIPSEAQSPEGWKIYKSRANVIQGADLQKHNKWVIDLLKRQPNSSAEEDIDPYITHSGLIGADDLETFDPDTSSESEREMERMRIVSEVRKEGEAEGLTPEQIDARLKERMEERTGSGILELDF